MKKCPYCSEMLKDNATFCQSCYHNLPEEHSDSINETHGNVGKIISVEFELKKSELEIADYEMRKASLQGEIDGLGRQYIIGGLGFFLGIVLVVVGFWPIGAVIGLAGLLSALTQSSKQGGKRKEIDNLDVSIQAARTKMRGLLEKQ